MSDDFQINITTPTEVAAASSKQQRVVNATEFISTDDIELNINNKYSELIPTDDKHTTSGGIVILPRKYN